MLMLDPVAMRVACARYGATTYGEMAVLLGVHRTTVMRAMTGTTYLGPTLHAALVNQFGTDEASRLFRFVEPEPVPVE